MSEHIERLIGMPIPFAMQVAWRAFQAKQYQPALEVLDQIRLVDPDHLDATHLAALCMSALGEKYQAIEILEQLVQTAKGRVETKCLVAFMTNLCSCYERIGEYEKALAIGCEAEELHPNDVGLLHNLGVTYYHRREPHKTIAYTNRILALDPDNAPAHLLRAESNLIQGKFEEGWPEYSWRFRLPGAPDMSPRLTVPRWDGSKLDNGRLLVVGDQGFGDIFFFWRFVKLLAACSPKPLAFTVPEEVKLVLANSAPPDALGLAPVSTFDNLRAWTTLSDLPEFFGAGIETDAIPQPPYLTPLPDRVAHWRQWLDARAPAGKPRIGLCWAGRPEYVDDSKRSMKFEQLLPLAQFDKATFVSLQKGPREADLGLWPLIGKRHPTTIINAGAAFSDWADTQACVACLDLVISVDTGIVHLAGAMNRPTWIMLPYMAEWRWGQMATTTPWYPKATLWRQPRPFDWHAVVTAILETLPYRVPVKSA